MSLSRVTPPFDVFTDSNGEPLEAGFIWVGVENLEPKTNPISIYWDSALTITAAQPIRTIAGYPSRGGTPAVIFANSNYSIRVETKTGSIVFSAPSPSGSADSLRGDLADSTNVALGDAMVAVRQPFTGAVATTQHEVNSRSVSAFDFMTPAETAGCATGTVNVQGAIQTAVNYCILNNKDLEVPGLCLLSSPVMIDRNVDGAAFDKYFTIFSKTGGGFIVSTATTMFSATVTSAAWVTSTAYVVGDKRSFGGNPYICDTNHTSGVFATDLSAAKWHMLPLSQLVRFKDVSFESSDSSLAAYVLDQNRFLRTNFVGCSFRKIKCLDSAAEVQSIYFEGCQGRRWVGAFFKTSTSGATFDLKVTDCLFEAGGDGFDLYFPVGCAFHGGNIEGMTNFAIKYVGGYALDISGVYFEGNGLGVVGGCSVDGSSGMGITGSEAVHIASNYFSGDSGDSTKPQIRWGDTVNSVSEGNLGTTTLHGLSAGSRVNIVGDYGRVRQSNLNPTSSTPTLLRSRLGINTYNPLKDLHIHATLAPVILATDATLSGENYGGYLTGYGTAGEGGFCGLGVINNGTLTQGLTIDQNGTTQLRAQNIAPVTAGNNTMAFQLISDTQLKILVKGSDGVTRSNTLALA